MATRLGSDASRSRLPQELLPRPLDLLGAHPVLADALQDREGGVADVVERLALGDLGQDQERPRVVPGVGHAANAGRLLGLDEGLVEPPRWGGGQDLVQHLHGRELRVRAGRHVVEHPHDADVADATERDDPLAVLRRLLGVGRIQLRPRLRQAPK